MLIPVLVLAAFALLTAAFVRNDFSVLYVASNSNSALPLDYRVAGVWGGHEGSLLLWVQILALWTLAVARFSQRLPLATVARVLSIMGLISVGFLCFMLFTSNPFERVLPALPDGRDLNPLLQDIGMILHPPLLYTGYVGFSVVFAFAIAALLGGELDATWARWSRPWTLIAWTFLTLGITLGSFWAYYELGWGGWWFWDAVENASFMPWLAGTALIHSLAVTERRGSLGIIWGDVDTRGLVIEPFRHDELALIVPAGHPFARRRSVRFVETLNFDFVCLEAESPIYAALRREAAKLNRQLRARIQVRGFDALCRMVEAGLGVGGDASDRVTFAEIGRAHV